jgi:hypothetical protein
MPAIFWLITLILGSVALPSLFGPREILAMPLFFSSLAVCIFRSRKAIIWGAALAIISDIIYDLRPGSYLFPFLAIAGIYYWLTKTVDTESYSLGDGPGTVIFRALIIMVIGYVFSLAFVAYQNGFGEMRIYWKFFLNSGLILYNLPLALVYSYFHKKII